MSFLRGLGVAALAAFIPVVAWSQSSVTFTNNDGTFVYNTDSTSPGFNELSLGGNANFTGVDGPLTANPGQLTAMTGLQNFGVTPESVAYPCSPCLGTITLQTAPATMTTISQGSSGQGKALFGMGGSFTVTYTDGVVFSGSFSSASFKPSGLANTWIFAGNIMNGTLTVPMSGGGSMTFSNIDAGTVHLTVVGAAPTLHPSKGSITYQDSQGTTNFSIAPEPGTLTLFGTGLLAVGAITRRKLAAKRDASIRS